MCLSFLEPFFVFCILCDFFVHHFDRLSAALSVTAIPQKAQRIHKNRKDKLY